MLDFTADVVAAVALAAASTATASVVVSVLVFFQHATSIQLVSSITYLLVRLNILSCFDYGIISMLPQQLLRILNKILLNVFETLSLSSYYFYYYYI